MKMTMMLLMMMMMMDMACIASTVRARDGARIRCAAGSTILSFRRAKRRGGRSCTEQMDKGQGARRMRQNLGVRNSPEQEEVPVVGIMGVVLLQEEEEDENERDQVEEEGVVPEPGARMEEEEEEGVVVTEGNIITEAKLPCRALYRVKRTCCMASSTRMGTGICCDSTAERAARAASMGKR